MVWYSVQVSKQPTNQPIIQRLIAHAQILKCQVPVALWLGCPHQADDIEGSQPFLTLLWTLTLFSRGPPRKDLTLCYVTLTLFVVRNGLTMHVGKLIQVSILHVAPTYHLKRKVQFNCHRMISKEGTDEAKEFLVVSSFVHPWSGVPRLKLWRCIVRDGWFR